MGMAEDLATYLDNQSTRFTIGTNLFINDLPHEPGTCSALIEQPGIAPRYTIGNSTKPAWENPGFQMTFRSTSSTKGRANAQAAWDVLESVANQALSGTTFMRVNLTQSPFFLRRDAQDRAIFAFNGVCMRRL